MRRFGPGMLVAAAFIGPGTVTTASIAGANFGFVLMWALLLSIIVTFVLQEMSSRLGIVSGLGLSEALRSSISNHFLKAFLMILIVSALGIGNAAFEVGNITGAAIGLSQISSLSISSSVLIVGILVLILLGTRIFKILEQILTVLVVIMSLLFLLTMITIEIDYSKLLRGLFIPTVTASSLLTIMALIGTTVVPYNLFLHADASKRKWKDQEVTQALNNSRADTAISIGLGGLITLAIMSTSAVAFFGSSMEISSENLARQLEPILGSYSSYIFNFGLFVAGITSAVTAPLAASIAVTEALGWKNDPSSFRFKLVWIIILLIGLLFAYFGTKPLQAILFAQATNALLLPFLALFLFYVVNNSRLMGSHKNTITINMIALIIIMAVVLLSSYKIFLLI
ncbi:MAG: Nramp family divalent metal transporter [Pseudomonadota bacterium]|nr:Nramp family divalent metal transporter [Pseudomonadota bacterium]